jgi:hypothetical protein
VEGIVIMQIITTVFLIGVTAQSTMVIRKIRQLLKAVKQLEQTSKQCEKALEDLSRLRYTIEQMTIGIEMMCQRPKQVEKSYPILLGYNKGGETL